MMQKITYSIFSIFFLFMSFATVHGQNKTYRIEKDGAQVNIITNQTSSTPKRAKTQPIKTAAKKQKPIVKKKKNKTPKYSCAFAQNTALNKKVVKQRKVKSQSKIATPPAANGQIIVEKTKVVELKPLPVSDIYTLEINPINLELEPNVATTIILKAATKDGKPVDDLWKKIMILPSNGISARFGKNNDLIVLSTIPNSDGWIRFTDITGSERGIVTTKTKSAPVALVTSDPLTQQNWDNLFSWLRWIFWTVLLGLLLLLLATLICCMLNGNRFELLADRINELIAELRRNQTTRPAAMITPLVTSPTPIMETSLTKDINVEKEANSNLGTALAAGAVGAAAGYVAAKATEPKPETENKKVSGITDEDVADRNKSTTIVEKKDVTHNLIDREDDTQRAVTLASAKRVDDNKEKIFPANSNVVEKLEPIKVLLRNVKNKIIDHYIGEITIPAQPGEKYKLVIKSNIGDLEYPMYIDDDGKLQRPVIDL